MSEGKAVCSVQVVLLFVGGYNRVIVCPSAALMAAISPGVIFDNLSVIREGWVR